MDLAELGIDLLADDAIDFSDDEGTSDRSNSCTQSIAAATAPAEPTSIQHWTHDECMAWLRALPRELGLQLQGVENDSDFCGRTLLAVADSTRELRDTLGLATITQRLAFDKALRDFTTAAGAETSQHAKATKPSGSVGGIYDATFLKLVEPLYDMHMGVENMGPLLYTLVRFIKPQRVLEIGAGYTTVFLLMALKDNAAELANYSALRAQGDACIVEQTVDDSGSASSRRIPWCVDAYMDSAAAATTPVLHCVDNMAHQHTTVDQYLLLITTTCSTARRQQSDCLRSSLQAFLHQAIAVTVYYAAVAAAHLVLQAAEELELEPHLKLHVVDAWKLEPSFEPGLQLDFLWIDFGAGRKLAEFLQQWWHRVPAGGIIALHSTVTNSYTREWLEEMRAGA
eukprot:1235-Heterococcus_DN1.PRE.1